MIGMPTSSSSSFLSSSSKAFASIFECICADGSCMNPVAAVSGTGSRSLGSIPGVQLLDAVTSRTAKEHESLDFFQWLKLHFDHLTDSKANGSWRLLITEEASSIDLFPFLWAFKHRILLVTVPAPSARAIQPIERGHLLDSLCKSLKNSLADMAQYNKSRDNSEASTTSAAATTPTSSSSAHSAPSPEANGGRSPASTSPQLQNLVVNLRSPSSSNAIATSSSSSSFSCAASSSSLVLDLAAFLTTYGVIHAQAFTNENIVGGWKQTGILPRNPNLVIDTVTKTTGPESIKEEQVLIDVSPDSTTASEQASNETTLSSSDGLVESLVDHHGSPFSATELLESGIEALTDQNLNANERSQKLFWLLQRAFDGAVDRNLTRHAGASAAALRNIRRSSSGSVSQFILEGATTTSHEVNDAASDDVFISRHEVRGDSLVMDPEFKIKTEEHSDDDDHHHHRRASGPSSSIFSTENGVNASVSTDSDKPEDGVVDNNNNGNHENIEEEEEMEEEESSLSRHREEQLLLPELSVELATKIRRYLHPSRPSRRRVVSSSSGESVSTTTVDEGIVTVEQVVTALLRFIDASGQNH